MCHNSRFYNIPSVLLCIYSTSNKEIFWTAHPWPRAEEEQTSMEGEGCCCTRYPYWRMREKWKEREESSDHRTSLFFSSQSNPNTALGLLKFSLVEVRHLLSKHQFPRDSVACSSPPWAPGDKPELAVLDTWTSYSLLCDRTCHFLNLLPDLPHYFTPTSQTFSSWPQEAEENWMQS